MVWMLRKGVGLRRSSRRKLVTMLLLSFGWIIGLDQFLYKTGL